ncbi:MAG: hypothetical protein RLZZ480_924 [Candidatus Parcubacteria bacterium]|jgi:hypothetical protein
MEKFSVSKSTNQESNRLSDAERIEAAETEMKLFAVGSALESLEPHEELLQQNFKLEMRRAGVENPDQRMESYIPLSEINIIARRDVAFMGRFDCDSKSIHINADGMYRSADAKARRMLDNDEDFQSLLKLNHKLESKWGAYNFIAMRKYFELRKRFLEKLDEVRESLLLLNVAETAIHEELHALSYESRYTAVKQDDEGFIAARKIGVQENSSQSKVDGSASFRGERYRAVNEGITELYTLKLAQEFLKQATPGKLSGEDMDGFFEFSEYHAYSRERWVVEQMIVIMSEISEVPESVVEDAFFAAYLNNEEIVPGEMLSRMTELLHDKKHEDVEALLLRLQVAMSENTFKSDSEIHRMTTEFVDHLPVAKQQAIKDRFEELFFKYSFTKELQDGVVE